MVEICATLEKQFQGPVSVEYPGKFSLKNNLFIIKDKRNKEVILVLWR